MTIEIKKGTVESLTPAKEDSLSTCRVSGQNIALHRDLADRILVEDQVVISGHETKDHFKAVAINNLSQRRVSAIDSSNLVLLLGLSLFASLVFSILGIQNMVGGSINLVITNFLLALLGLVGLAITFSHLYTIRSALKAINHL